MKDFVHVPYTPLPMRVDVPTPRFLGVDELPCERRGHHFGLDGICIADGCNHGAVDILTHEERIEHARAVAVQLEQQLAAVRQVLAEWARVEVGPGRGGMLAIEFYRAVQAALDDAVDS